MAKITEVCEVTRSKLKPYERNAKIHSEEQVQKIADSINEFGFVSPCLIDRDYNIIAGHGRVMAAKLLGMDTVPCVFIEGLTDEQRRAYILADNRLTELGAWDIDLVTSELEDIDIDIEMLGFDFSHEQYIDDLIENGLEHTRVEATQFQVSFIIDKEYEGEVKAYIRNNGKEPLVRAIIEEVKRDA